MTNTNGFPGRSVSMDRYHKCKNFEITTLSNTKKRYTIPFLTVFTVHSGHVQFLLCSTESFHLADGEIATFKKYSYALLLDAIHYCTPTLNVSVSANIREWQSKC